MIPIQTNDKELSSEINTNDIHSDNTELSTEFHTTN